MIIARFSYYIHAVCVWMCPDPSHKARTRSGTRNRTMPIDNETHAPQPVATYDARKNPGGGGGGACWSTVYRCANKGLQNLSLTVCLAF